MAERQGEQVYSICCPYRDYSVESMSGKEGRRKKVITFHDKCCDEAGTGERGSHGQYSKKASKMMC